MKKERSNDNAGILPVLWVLAFFALLFILIFGIALLVLSFIGGDNKQFEIPSEIPFELPFEIPSKTSDNSSEDDVVTVEPYDYSFIDEIMGKDLEAVEAWLNKYYINYTYKSSAYENTTRWVVTPGADAKPISIGGYVYEYKKVDIILVNGKVEDITFVNYKNTKNLFNSTYDGLKKIYGEQELYTDENKDTGYLYMSYLWAPEDFDNNYTLGILLSKDNTEDSMFVLFSIWDG